MLSIARAREQMGEDAIGLSDKEIQDILDLLKGVCSIVVEDHIKRNTKPVPHKDKI